MQEIGATLLRLVGLPRPSRWPHGAPRARSTLPEPVAWGLAGLVLIVAGAVLDRWWICIAPLVVSFLAAWSSSRCAGTFFGGYDVPPFDLWVMLVFVALGATSRCTSAMRCARPSYGGVSAGTQPPARDGHRGARR